MMRRRALGWLLGLGAIVALGRWAVRVPLHTGPTLTVRSTKVEVDHLMTSARYAKTFVTVDFDYHPATTWDFLFVVPDFARDHYTSLQTPRGMTTSFSWGSTGGGGGPIWVTVDPNSTPHAGESGVRLIYVIPWVGTGTLVDRFPCDGHMIEVSVPFDDRRSVPRPEHDETGRW